jgi:hypothetical protein
MKLLNDSSNTAHGQTALYSNITGNHNTAIGVNALQSNTKGTRQCHCGAAESERAA